VNKLTGEPVWQSTVNDNPAYCSPALLLCEQRKVIVTMMLSQMVGVDSKSGTLLWSHPFVHSNPVYCNTPALTDSMLFTSVSQGYGDVGLRLTTDGASVTEVYHGKDFQITCGGFIVLDGYVYAATDSGAMCMLVKTGEKVWGPEKAVTRGTMIYADGLFYCYSETGKISLLKAAPAGCEVTSSFIVPNMTETMNKEHLAHLAIADGKLYIRHGTACFVYDIKAGKT